MLQLYIILLHLIIVGWLYGLSKVYNKNHPYFKHYENTYYYERYFTPVEKIAIPYYYIGTLACLTTVLCTLPRP
jgi:hypothetical protein